MKKDGRQRRRGAAMIEASLILIVVLAFLLSVFTFGYVLFLHQTIMHQARTAARYAAIHPTETNNIKNMLVFGRTDPADGATGLFGLTTSMVSITPPPADTTGASIVITVSGYKYPALNPFTASLFTGKPITVSLPIETE